MLEALKGWWLHQTTVACRTTAEPCELAFYIVAPASLLLAAALLAGSIAVEYAKKAPLPPEDGPYRTR